MYLSGEQDRDITIEITKECLFERHACRLSINLSQIKKELSHWNVLHKVQINIKAAKKNLIWLITKIKCIRAATSIYAYVTVNSLQDWNTTEKKATLQIETIMT